MKLGNNRYGPTITAISFVIWGVLPLYFVFLPGASLVELSVFRCVWGMALFYLLVFLAREQCKLRSLSRKYRELVILFFSSFFYFFSWVSFMWALTSGHVLEASLGFFMTPIFNILFGVFLLRERLDIRYLLATLLAFSGIVYMSFSYGGIPWLSLLMGSFFALYGLLKKVSRAPMFSSVFLECLFQLPFILVVCVFTGHANVFLLVGNISHFLMFSGAALINILPVAIFTLGISRTRLSTVGFLQYIEPSLAFLIGFFILGEPLDMVTFTGFCFVWFGLLVTVLPKRGKHHSKALGSIK